MSAPTLTLQGLLALGPCAAASRRIIAALGGANGWTSPVTAAQAREAGATFSDLIWVTAAVARTDTDVARRLRLWTADCAAYVLHIYERTGMSHAPRNAILAARRLARGEIGTDDLAAARDAAEAAAWVAAEAAAWAAAWNAAGGAAWAAEATWQFDRLVLWLSDDEPEDWPLPSRKGGDA